MCMLYVPTDAKYVRLYSSVDYASHKKAQYVLN